MKNLIIGLILLNSLTVFSQNIELFGGLNRNSFFDYRQVGHFVSSYNSELGYSFGVGVDNIKLNQWALRFTLNYDKYGGKVTASDGGLGSTFRTIAEIDKSIVSLGVFPVNFKLFDRIDLNFGFEISGLINEKVKGSYSTWSKGQPYRELDLNDKYERFSSMLYFGLRGRIAYDFNLSDNLAISPQYSYYFGLSNEFVGFPEKTKSMRHYLGIGLQRKIN